VKRTALTFRPELPAVQDPRTFESSCTQDFLVAHYVRDRCAIEEHLLRSRHRPVIVPMIVW
jgi:hypothetical protein